MSTVSLIVPARNEGARLTAFLQALRPSASCLHETVLVLDGCTDDSGQRAAEAAKDWPGRFAVVTLAGGGGKLAAVQTGLWRASGEVALLWDADMEYDPTWSVSEVVGAAARHPRQFVSGTRACGLGWKSIAARMLTRLALRRWGSPPADPLTGVHAAPMEWMRRALAGITDGHGYTLEAALVQHAMQDRLVMHEIPVPYRARSLAQGRGVRAHHLPGILRAAWGEAAAAKARRAALRFLPALLMALMASLHAPVARAVGTPVFDPLLDTNWLDMFPIATGGLPLGGLQPPTVNEPPVCVCPSHLLGVPLPGVGMSFWEPSYIAEVTRKPGHLLTLGGVPALGPLFDFESGPSEGNETASASGGENHQNVHWYAYPLFKIIGMGLDSACTSEQNPFGLGYMTEVDPTWQSDIWAEILSPESILFANPIAQLACAADAASAAVWYPLDPLFWCAGSWGSIYPFSANGNSVSSDAQANALEVTKFLARMMRTGQLLGTITPLAMCSSFLSPVIIKTQWRLDPVYPHPIYGAPIYIGQTEIRWGTIPPANFPLGQDSAYLIWQAQQCCLRP